MRRRSRPVRTRVAVTALACGAAVLPAAAGAAVPQIEQLNRATGANGAFGLMAGPIQPNPGIVTNDGRFNVFGLSTERFAYVPDLADASPGLGLYMRDIVSNTTTKLTSTDAFATGLDQTEHLFSFITREGLDPADRNNAPDVYVYERTTGAKVLISRADGYRGAALGVTSEGAVLRGSRIAIFGTADGVFRRDLLTGKTTKVSGGYYGGITDPEFFSLSGAALSDEYASADGKVVATSEGVFAPGRTTPPSLGGSGQPLRTFVSADGKRAVSQSDEGAPTVRILNPATGQVTSPASPAGFTGRSGAFLLRVAADGRSGLVSSFETNTFKPHLDVWNFDATTLTASAIPFGTLPSRNLKYGQSAAGYNNPAVVTFAAPGNLLPGTVEVPSANAYVDLTDECTDGENGQERLVVARVRVSEFLPASKSLRVRVTRPGGQLLVDKTLATPGPGDPFTGVSLPVGSGAFRVETTVTLADGRKSTERTNKPALPAGTVCYTRA